MGVQRIQVGGIEIEFELEGAHRAEFDDDVAELGVGKLVDLV